MISLYASRLPGRLAAALDRSAMEGAVALLSAPSAFAVAVVANGRLHDPTGELDVAGVFEARCFTPSAELRWVQRGDSGLAVLLSEDLTVVSAFGGDDLDPVEAVETIDQQYLLWGVSAPVGAGAGWCELVESRIGAISVPLEAGGAAGARVALKVREYVSVEPSHGNAFIADERLLAIVPAVGGVVTDGAVTDDEESDNGESDG